MSRVEFQELAIQVELLKEEIRYNPENLDDAARAIFEQYETELAHIEDEGE